MDHTPEYVDRVIKADSDLKQLAECQPLFSRRERMMAILDGRVVPWGTRVNNTNVHRAIPLWEQDQLQRMLALSEGDIIQALTNFYDSEHCCEDNVHHLTNHQCHRCNGTVRRSIHTSMEQWHLSLVMFRLFHKIWNNENKNWEEVNE